MLELNEINNPFPGIRPFEMDETNLFFGRDGQSDELLKRMQRSRLLAVVGTSGSGKSSLIRAGLLPALYGGLMGDAGSSWRIAIQRPGGDPIGNLAAALADRNVFGLDTDSEIQTTLIETTLRRSSIGLVDVTRQARMAAHENLLVVVDQFEELFRFKQSQTNDDATAFVKLLLEASAQRDLPIYIIITMRSDFLGDCSQFTGLPEAINNGQYLIPRMSRDERQSAIVGPIAVGAGEITQPLVSRLLNDVGDNPDQLPILQHALMRTWDYWSGHRLNGDPIGLEHYTAIGTMSEALSRHADEAFNELPDERSKLIAEKLFKRLTEKGADNREIRRPTPLAELSAVCEAGEDEVSAIIDVFRAEGRSFLMPPLGAKLNSETVIDISHESLIRNWMRLQKWVDEEAQSTRTYRRLAEATVLHREGSEGLLQDPGLQIALDWFEKNQPNAAWAQRYHPEFDAAKKYLEESCEAREAAEFERERRRNAELERERREREQAELFAAVQARAARRLRAYLVGLCVFAIIALAGAGVAVYAFSKAKQNETKARASEMAAQAEKQKAQDLASQLKTSLDDLTLAKAKADKATAIANEALLAAKNEADRAVKAEKIAIAARADAQEKARIAEREKNNAKLEATRNLKAKEANDLFRDASLLAQRGRDWEAKSLFQDAIGAYQDPDVANDEARADTNVELGHLDFTVALDAYQRNPNFRLAAVGPRLLSSTAKYDEAAKIYAGPKVNSLEKAAATEFASGLNLLKIVRGNTSPGRSRQPNSAESKAAGELPELSFFYYENPDGLMSFDYDPMQKFTSDATERLRNALGYYRKLYDANRAANPTNAEAGREGIKRAAYQLGNFYMNEANALDATLPSPERAQANRREAIKYFEELHSMLGPGVAPGADKGRLLTWLGGLHSGLSRGGNAEESARAAEKYFADALAIIRPRTGMTEGDALRKVADTLEGSGQSWEAADFYRRAREAYHAGKSSVNEADMFFRLGQISERKRRLDAVIDDYYYAMDLYRRALEQDKSAGLPENAYRMGIFFKGVGGQSGYNSALRAFDLAIALGVETKRDDLQIYQARAYNEKALILSLMNKPKEALEAYRSALDVYNELATAPYGYQDSKEQAAAEAERVRVSMSLLQSGMGKEGVTPKP